MDDGSSTTVCVFEINFIEIGTTVFSGVWSRFSHRNVSSSNCFHNFFFYIESLQKNSNLYIDDNLIKWPFIFFILKCCKSTVFQEHILSVQCAYT